MKMEVVNDVSRDTHYLRDLTSALKLAWLKPQLCSNRAAGISTHKLATHYSTQAGAGAPGQSKPGKKFELQLRQSSTSEMEGRATASIYQMGQYSIRHAMEEQPWTVSSAQHVQLRKQDMTCQASVATKATAETLAGETLAWNSHGLQAQAELMT